MKRFPVILAPALLGSLLMLGGCAATGPSTAPLPPDRDCQEVYTAAPGNYIIDIAGGSVVVLDPAVQMFIVSPLFGFGGSSMANLFSTHPPLEERIARLQEMSRRAR